MDADPSAVRFARWRVFGLVQGVGFRWFVMRAAAPLDVRGDVSNLPDGSVEVRVAGRADALAQLLDAVQEGPRSARVDRVEQLAAEHDLPREGFAVRVGGERSG